MSIKRIEQPTELTHRIDVTLNAPFIFNDGYQAAFMQHMKALYAKDSAFREQMANEARALVVRKLLERLNQLMPDANVTIDMPRHMPRPVSMSTRIS